MTNTHGQPTNLADAHRLIDQYRCLVGALLENTRLDNEGTEMAIADFQRGNDRAQDILRLIVSLQGQALDETGFR